MKKSLSLILVFLLLCLPGCADRQECKSVKLGENLPTWEFSDPLYRESLPSDAAETGLAEAYQSDKDDRPDVYLYRYENGNGMSLEDFGSEQAAACQVFCNMISYGGVPTANITYCSDEYGEPCIVRSYIFDDGDAFVKICLAYKTEETDLAESDYSIRLMNGYTQSEVTDSVFPYEKVYEYEDEYLPTLRVRQFAKDYFTADGYEASLMPGTDSDKFAAYAADGWTLEEFVSFYDDNFDLLKGELIYRNGLDAGFVGYIDSGVFYVRALIDCGDEYVMLCAENDAAKFQHMVNALIDTIEVE